MDIQASWMKTNLSERQRKKHIINFHNFTLLQNKYATIRSMSYTERDDVSATNSITKIMEDTKIWFLSPGGDFVTI